MNVVLSRASGERSRRRSSRHQEDEDENQFKGLSCAGRRKGQT